MQSSTKPILQILVGMLGVVLPSAALAQHVDNPYTGATVYKNPDYAAKVQTSIDQTTDANLRTKMAAVAQIPSYVWLDRMAAIAGSATETGLQEHLDNALAQKGSGPIIAQFVIYDLPGRDCHALASNGELPLTAAGLATYKTSYIDPIVAIMSQPQYAGIRIVTVIEPDSLPNLVTNLSTPACGQASSTGIYVQATQYALNRLHALPNVYTYMDLGHSGWLGWPTNAGPAVTLFTQVADGTTAKRASVDGFVTDTANTTPLREPLMTATQSISGQPVMNSNYFQFNPDIDEASFTADMYARFTGAGWPASIGFLIDTSRNGWGGSNRPTAASTSTDLNTFVNATRIDPRPHRGLWCNQNGAGLGERPQVSPPGFPASHLDAFVWVKPPGDSDGSSSLIPNNEGKGFDRFCDPTFTTPDGTLTNALPNAPISGQWFHTQFVQLVQNAFPAVGGGNVPPPPVCAIAPSATASVTASAMSSSQINLAWAAVTPPANCPVSYSVYRSTVTGFTPTAANQIASGLTTTAFSDTGRAASTTYFYVVQTVDTAGTAIARASATTLAGPVTGNGTCHVGYTITNAWSTGFQVALSIQNTGTLALNGWTLTWTFPSGQSIASLWNGTATQSASAVTVTNLGYNANIAAGASSNDVGFVGNGAGAAPTSFSINGVVCN
jgi:cellulose 1,4-beta-cellobiosidase